MVSLKSILFNNNNNNNNHIGPIVTPALILTYLLLTLGNYTPKGI